MWDIFSPYLCRIEIVFRSSFPDLSSENIAASAVAGGRSWRRGHLCGVAHCLNGRGFELTDHGRLIKDVSLRLELCGLANFTKSEKT